MVILAARSMPFDNIWQREYGRCTLITSAFPSGGLTLQRNPYFTLNVHDNIHFIMLSLNRNVTNTYCNVTVYFRSIELCFYCI